MKIIAVCTNLDDLDQNGLDRADLCVKYPGSGWIPHFARLARALGYRVLSGSRAVEAAVHGDVSHEDIHVVQEEQNRYGQALIDNGAEPAVVFCQESPIYTPLFYDALPELKRQFRAQVLFDGGTHHMHFPSFDAAVPLPDLVPWRDRKDTVMVMAAKHYSMLGDRWKDSPSWQLAIKTQLHDARFAAIEQLKPDLFGKGFERSIPDGGKIDVIRQYRHAVCFENGAYPGYITEKIIDCFVAGVVPIYAGAPDLERYIPRKAHDPEHMHAWLRSPDGHRYSYQGFARDMLGILEGTA